MAVVSSEFLPEPERIDVSSASDGTVAASLAVAALLGACGPVDADPAHRMLTEVPADRPDLLDVDARRRALSAPGTAPRTPTADQFFTWLQLAFGEQFPADPPTRTLSLGSATSGSEPAPLLLYRLYANGNVVGVLSGQVLLISPTLTEGALVRLGPVDRFPQAAGIVTDRQASRFLQHATFGVADGDLLDVKMVGLESWLEDQMSKGRTQRSWDWMQANGYAAIDDRVLVDSGGWTAECVLAKEAATAGDPVRQRVALALAEYFVVSSTVPIGWAGMAMAHYWDQLQDHAFGNFRDLLEAITLNPAMGAWLNMRGNLKEDPATGRMPDENYAREVMQLFTIGLVQLHPDGTAKLDSSGQSLPTYSQDDITELARVMTGWDWWSDGKTFTYGTVDNKRPYPEFTRRAMVFDASRHSTRESTVLGRRIPAGADGPRRLKAALDILFEHPNVGPFFGRQMIQRLVSSNPSPGYVRRVASAFNDNGKGVRGDLKAVWRAVLLDEESTGEASLYSSVHGKVREPMVRILQWLRTFPSRSRSGGWLWPGIFIDPQLWYGQRPFSAPSVFNYFRPGYVPPGTAMAESGATAPEFQILNESTVCQWINAIDRLNLEALSKRYAYGDFEINPHTELALAHDTRALVDRLNLKLAAGQISLTSVDRIIQVLEAGGRLPPNADDESRGWRVLSAITLVMSSVEYLVQK